MKNKITHSLLICVVICLGIAGCAKKLDIFPQNELTPEKVYANAAGYNAVLAKIYATLSVTGNSGGDGGADINGLDPGSQTAFIRNFFNAQELTTDHAVVAWNDQTIQDFHNLSYNSGDFFVQGIYARPIYNITLINEYIRESSDSKLAERNITGAAADGIKKSRAEARFLRAFNYWVMMDLFGKSTFITEADLVGAFRPKEISRANLFTYIESELKDIDAELPAVKTAIYGRVDQGAAWALLARIYLNAEVYSGTPRFTDAITYSSKVIGGGYSLHNNYRELFMADNNRTSKNEFIFTANCDGFNTTSNGNTTFFIHAPVGADNADFGSNSGWFGYRATSGLANQFPDLTGATDKRAMFTTSAFGTAPSQIAIPVVSDFSNGLHVAKYRNIRADGGVTNDPTNYFSDIDFPIFRLAEMHLIYAESVLRGGTGGSLATAFGYITAIRNRAQALPIVIGQMDLNFILAERARELYWEGHRRTDLVRYNLLTTGTYLWPWKGGVAAGTSVNSKYNLFPIPSAARNSNENLTQNTGF